MSWPDAWEFVLLALAAYRTTRLVGWDTILDGPRDKLTRRATAATQYNRYRSDLDKFLHCPWCMGFWVTLLWWGAWQAWPHATLVVGTPFALNAVVGLVTKNLDE